MVCETGIKAKRFCKFRVETDETLERGECHFFVTKFDQCSRINEVDQ